MTPASIITLKQRKEHDSSLAVLESLATKHPSRGHQIWSCHLSRPISSPMMSSVPTTAMTKGAILGCSQTVFSHVISYLEKCLGKPQPLETENKPRNHPLPPSPLPNQFHFWKQERLVPWHVSLSVDTRLKEGMVWSAFHPKNRPKDTRPFEAPASLREAVPKHQLHHSSCIFFAAVL